MILLGNYLDLWSGRALKQFLIKIFSKWNTANESSVFLRQLKMPKRALHLRPNTRKMCSPFWPLFQWQTQSYFIKQKAKTTKRTAIK